LRQLQLRHPKADEIAQTLTPVLQDARVVCLPSPTPGLVAHLDTPNGPVVLE